LIRSQPVVRLCRLRALPFGESDANEDVFFQDGLILLHDPKAKRSDPPQKYPVDFVHGPLATSEDVCNRDVPPLVEAALRGNNAVFICMGSDDAGKSFTLDGRKGVCCETIRLLHGDLMDRKTEKMKDSSSSYSFTMKMRYYELYNEYVNDLLAERGGQVIQVQDTVDGVQVKGLTGFAIASSQEAADMIEKAQHKRNRSTKKKTHTVLQLEVTQVDHKQAYGLFAKVLIIEMAALDCLGEDRDVVQLKEGFNAFRGVYNFCDLVYNWQPKQVGEVNASLLTWLLHDLFAGGNLYATVLLCIQHMQYPVSIKALDLLKALTQVRTNPVAFDNRLAGLYRALKAETLQTKQSLASLQQYAHGVEVEEKTKRHIHELEGRVLEEEIGRVKALEEKRFLQGKVEELKEKYKNTVVAQAETQKSMIVSEEERLKLSQALVTMQIRMITMQNDLSEQQYQDTAKIVTFEQDLVDLTTQVKRKTDELASMEEKLNKTEKDRKAIEMELITSRNNWQNAQSELEMKELKNEESRAEMEKFMESKKYLEKRFEGAECELKETKTGHSDLSKALGVSEEKNGKLEQRVKELEKALEKETTDRLKKELQVEKAQADFATAKVELEKNHMDHVRVRESDLNELKTKSQTESQKTETQVSELAKNNEELKKEIRSLKRQVSTLEEETSLSRTAEDEVRKANQELEIEISNLKRDFQRQLSNLVTSDKGKDGEAGPDASIFLDARNVDDVLAKMVEMVNLAGSKEKELLSKQKRLQNQSRALQDKVAWLHHLCMDWAPDGEVALKEKVSKALREANEEARKMSDCKQEEEKGLVDQNRQLRMELEMERKSAAGDKLNMSKQLKRLQMEQANSQVELLALRKLKEDMDGASTLQVLPEMSKVQKKLLQEVEALRRGDQSSKGGDNGGTYQELVQKNAFLKAKVERLSANTPAEFKVLQQRCDFLDKNIKALESERSQLLVRCTVAEEQLKQFEIYMKEMMNDYQRQIAQLKR